MKKLLLVATMIIAGLLSACNQLTQYTITEQEINQALAKRAPFSKDVGLQGVADAHLVLTNLQSQIGREEPNKITLTGDASLKLTSIFGDQNAALKLTLKATPFFDADKGAIYLHDLDITNATVAPEKMQSLLQTLMPYLSQSLRGYFNENPAYVLSEDRSTGEKVAKKFAKGIEVKPGVLVIPLL